MVSVLHLVTGVSASSIPLEIAEKLHTDSEIDVQVATFYDSTNGSTAHDDPDHTVPVTTLGAQTRFDIAAYRRLHKQLSSVDFLHTHQNFIGSIARAVAATTDTQIVDTEHRNHESFTLLQNLVNAPTLPLADRVVSNSEQTKGSLRWYERLLLEEEKLEVIYNGVDIDRIEQALAMASKKTPDAENDTPLRIVSVGRLVPVKNYATLVRAFAKIQDEIPGAELVIVGDGSEREQLIGLAAELGVETGIRFAGLVPREEVYQTLATSDVFAICSTSEGFCVAAVEAMASGLPVVVSDIDVLHEVVGTCGRYAQPHAYETFATEIVELYNDERTRIEEGRACKQRARSEFDIDETARQYAELYQEIITEET
ncbi:glycosyltransferase family 4 protein [Haloplanus natans]|uniref:glycosyltransferase family 4 protein n=1 Tax=Haloplanus natans TaxID=376171 RepID=UPI0006776725|nr:glycosyltransferase [Haloplanus natans]